MDSPEQAAWDERYSGSDLVWGTGPNRFVAEETARLPPGTAIDLGTGEGRNAIWLAERGWQVTAVDFSAAGLERAARLAAERSVSVTWVQANLLGWQAGERVYDLVLIAYVHLPHESLASLFRAAAAAVAAGGTLLVIGHDRDNLSRGYGGPPDPDRLYAPAEITAELDGLMIRRADQVLRRVRTADGERTAIDTLVRAERPAVDGGADRPG
jgi:SAM-dependent methyltransferase